MLEKVSTLFPRSVTKERGTEGLENPSCIFCDVSAEKEFEIAYEVRRCHLGTVVRPQIKPVHRVSFIG